MKSKHIIRSQILTGADAKLIAQWADKTGVNVHAFSLEQGLITPCNSKYTQHESEINDIDISIVDFATLDDDAGILKVMMIAEAPELTSAIAQLPAELYQRFTIVQSAPFFLEFMNPTSNKGTGVKALAEHLGIHASEVITFGDAGNDAHMIEYAGLGIAMGNATDEIKQLANHITDTNNNSGVAKAIEQFVLN